MWRVIKAVLVTLGIGIALVAVAVFGYLIAVIGTIGCVLFVVYILITEYQRDPSREEP